MLRQKKTAKLWCSQYRDSLRTGQPDVLTPMRARDFLFPATVQTGPGAHSVSRTRGTKSLPQDTASGEWVYHPPPSSTEFKEWVQLHFYAFTVSLHLLRYDLYVPIISSSVFPSLLWPESTLLIVSILISGAAVLFCDLPDSLAFIPLIYASR